MSMKNNPRGRTAILLVIAAVVFAAMASQGRLDRVRAVDALSLFGMGALVGSAWTRFLVARRQNKIS